MNTRAVATLIAGLALAGAAQAQTAAETVPVTVDNFVRAESDLYFTNLVKRGPLGTFAHTREPSPIDDQSVIRLNRDTLYSSGLFDLAAGPVTITMPDAGDRFMSLQVINEDHYVPAVYYGAGVHTFDEATVGTRYMVAGVRTLVDPADPEDLAAVHALQDGIGVAQAAPGAFEVPAWDPVSQKTVRDALVVLGGTLPDYRGAFGTREEVDPIRHLIGSAAAWGGNPERDATYLNVTPARRSTG